MDASDHGGHIYEALCALGRVLTITTLLVTMRGMRWREEHIKRYIHYLPKSPLFSWNLTQGWGIVVLDHEKTWRILSKGSSKLWPRTYASFYEHFWLVIRALLNWWRQVSDSNVLHWNCSKHLKTTAKTDQMLKCDSLGPKKFTPRLNVLKIALKMIFVLDSQQTENITVVRSAVLENHPLHL